MRPVGIASLACTALASFAPHAVGARDRATAVAPDGGPPLLVATDAGELLAVTWSDDAPRVERRGALGAAAPAVRRLFVRGRVDDAEGGRVHTLAEGELRTYAREAPGGGLRAVAAAPTLPLSGDAGDDLAAVPGSTELLHLDDGVPRLRQPEHPLGSRLHRAFATDAVVLSAAIDPRTHRIAYLARDPAGGPPRLRLANPPGEVDLGDVRPALVRWSAATPAEPLLPEALPAPPERATSATRDRPWRLAFGSCADEDAGTARAWRLAAALSPDAFVLLGDTPYIDSTAPEVQARRYREFAAFPPFAELARSTQILATWDDHDFGADGSDGRLAGKEHARAAFLAARSDVADPRGAGPVVPWEAAPRSGADDGGVHSSFHVGAGDADLFLLDTRWFARTAPSEFDPTQPTLLGAAQWEWLRAGLRASRARYKLLACGMIWNGAVRPGKDDHWGAYPAEFEGLCRFLGAEGIDGVVLMGGDIHRARVVVHPTADTVGYDLLELISSPMHARVIERANVAHPGLRFDAGAGHVVCTVASRLDALEVTFQTPDEVLHTELITPERVSRAR